SATHPVLLAASAIETEHTLAFYNAAGMLMLEPASVTEASVEQHYSRLAKLFDPTAGHVPDDKWLQQLHRAKTIIQAALFARKGERRLTTQAPLARNSRPHDDPTQKNRRLEVEAPQRTLQSQADQHPDDAWFPLTKITTPQRDVQIKKERHT